MRRRLKGITPAKRTHQQRVIEIWMEYWETTAQQRNRRDEALDFEEQRYRDERNARGRKKCGGG